MDSREQREFYQRVGARIGWDFSSVKYTTEGAKWDFYREVSVQLSTDHLWLDIGTGGGEKVLRLAHRAYLLIGIDYTQAMVETAQKNLAQSDVINARFFVMDARQLQFPPGFFDIVTARHCDFSPAEVARVLTPGGKFMTQQVDIDDKENLVEAFGRGEMTGWNGPVAEHYARELAKHGFQDIELDYYDADEYYKTPEDLLFVLKHTPIIPDFGRPGDLEIFQQFVRENTTERGIYTNAHRSLIRARRG